MSDDTTTPTLWAITWTAYDDDGTTTTRERIVHAPAPNPDAANELEAVPTDLHRWAVWVGFANYTRQRLTTIEYALDHPADVTGATWDEHGRPHLIKAGFTNTICTVRYGR
jgi:hypothetical protein